MAPKGKRETAKKAAKVATKKKKAPTDASYVGRRVSRKFSGKVYSGTVTKFLPKHRIWKIAYDDGDAEEMDWGELWYAMDLYDGKIMSKKKLTKKGQDVKSKAAGYRVVRETYPSSGSDAYRDVCIVGEYETKEQAHKAARSAMDSTEQFEDWGLEHYAGKPPPYSSAEGPFEAIADEDEFVDIYVVDIGLKEAAKTRELERAKKSLPPPKKSTAKTTAATVSAAASAAPSLSLSARKFGPTKEAISVDGGIFARNPCRIAGGKAHSPSSYPNYHKGTGSFGFLIQRLSDRNYAMRAHCLDGAGAEYNSYQLNNYMNRSVVWIAPTNLNDHAEDDSIVDGCHLDLIDPNDGKIQLTGLNLKSAVDARGEKVECLFLNGAQTCDQAGVQSCKTISVDDITESINRCRDTLHCLALTECIVNGNTLEAIASCTKLRGIILENLQLRGGDATDDKLASVLRSCSNLQFIFVKASIFGTECWNVLAAQGSCPNLEVLWVDAPNHTESRIHVARGDHDTIRSALNGRSDKLKLCMINPDKKLKSRYILGGAKKTDRLNGEERPPMPSWF